jgi:N-acetylmuramoyl-L-alanine amidase
MVRKIFLVSLGFAVFAGLTSYVTKSSFKSVPALRKIIIDAGHGGHDGGADGKYSNEKTVSLHVALKLGQLIAKEIPDVEVVYTRTSDIYQHPATKANIANQAKGDLFISVHCNSAAAIRHREFTGYKTETYYTGKGKNRKKRTRKVPTYRTWYTPNPAKGTETYIWGAHKNDDKEKAMRENEALYLDSTLADQVKDFDPNDPEKIILYSLKTKQYFQRSANLAMTVEDEFKKTGRISREARQRQIGIWVLQAVAMPSVLIELGFISNPDEEKYLNSDEGQAEMVTAIVRAVKRYKYSLENQLIETGNR